MWTKKTREIKRNPNSVSRFFFSLRLTEIVPPDITSVLSTTYIEESKTDLNLLIGCVVNFSSDVCYL